MKKILLSFFLIFSNVLFAQSSQWIIFNGANSRLPNNNVSSIAIDHQDLKWVGTDGYGLARFDGRNWTIYNSKNSGLSNDFVRVIFVDKYNNKWIGTRYGGLYKFDGTNWQNWNTSNSFLPSNWVASLVIDHNGVVWIGTGDNGLARLDLDNWTVYNKDNSPLPVNFVYALAADSVGNVWIGTNGGGLIRYDGINWEIKNKYNSNLTCNASLSIAVDKFNDKWIASYSCGLFRLHDTTFTKFDKSPTSLRDHWVNCVTLENQEIKWLGMDSTGVARFDGDKWTIYDTSNSALPDKYVRTIAVDKLGNKWIGTVRGGVAVFNENGVNIPSVIVVSQPVNGASWIAGSRQEVTWLNSNVSGNVNIKLSTDGGSTFNVDLAQNIANDGSEEVDVPNVTSPSCVIRIESASDPQLKGISSGAFQIVAMTAPTPSKPADKAAKQPLAVKLSWNKGAWCTSYRLILALDSTFSTSIILDSTITDTVKEVKGLLDFRQYYWKVQGLNSGTSTNYSPVWSFTTVFNAPNGLSASASGKDKITISWKDNSESETGYVVERKSTSDFIAVANLKANSTTFTDSMLQAPASYQYRVKAVAKEGESDYSNTASASVTAVSDKPAIVKEFLLEQNYPNPFNPATTIRYNLPETADVKLTIYNTLGMAIRTFTFSSQPAGYQSVLWNGKNFSNEQASSGTYICRMEATTLNGKVTERIIKMIMLK
ncbi:MAG TPA: two-component regulator propeller domain-containing protein [Ignavibacteriales bacterium]|nr:two-component regulator propeller domain-containing protein [Ignavibacteriales bacterium]